MQIAGPYDLLSAVRRALPKSLKILEGEQVDVEWYLQDELPVTQPNTKGKPLPNPHGVFRILAVRPRNAVAAEASTPYRLQLTDKSEAITFTTGMLSYEVTEQDIASVTSVTGTVGAVPGHVFVAGTDYTFAVDSIVWTSGGTKPDNGTSFTALYKHRMYYPRKVMDTGVTIRAVLKTKAFTSGGGKDYPMSMFAAVLGNSLEMKLRSMSGGRMTRPASPDEPYTETVTMGRILAAGTLPIDESGSLASWFVDFNLNIGGIFEDDPVQAILDMPVAIEFAQ